MTRLSRLAAALGLLALCGGCGGGVDRSTDLGKRTIRVVTTVGMITDVVQVVGGDRVEVTGLMGPGIDPHTYKPTFGDLQRMGDADVVFHNGLHLEGKMGETFEEMEGRVRTVAVTSHLDLERDIRPAPEGYEGTHDPHVWFDVRLWMKAVEAVRDTLSAMDPAHAATYAANAKAYLKELADLHEYVKGQAAKVPPERRVLVTAHDAFYYFGHAYGFEVHGLQGVSTAAEPSAKDVQNLAKFLAERKVPAIFVESSVSPKALEAVRAAVKARGYEVGVGGELFSDAMGDPGTPEGTYVGMVRHNIDTIVKALAP